MRSKRSSQLEASLNKQGTCTNDLKRLVQSKFEKERRDKNIILHNIVESEAENPLERAEHDKEVFRSVVNALIGEDEDVEVENVFRLGKKQDKASDGGRQKPRLMLVTVKEKDHVSMLIKQRTKLKERGFSNVYTTHYLIPDGREEQRKVLVELEEKGKDDCDILGNVVPRWK